ncbi:rubrerythrin family protein [Clostridium sp. LY3-2]|uniref:rubrerythrin family protein n=1 Tax=Clostridium sp. LY3-2 TaxID=2942482 RepID=UPI002153304C|nr:rubrerythrin family protein [Clostridium sp. LY3-2]MCR6515654.1 rubrerythrin family protein [Clostridium sp. LY3-2]
MDSKGKVKDLKGSQTEKNLYKTFAGESRARAKYNLYAEKAREDGYMWVGDIFDETSKNEFAHLREAYKRFLKNVKSTEDNLIDSINGEGEEADSIYLDFEKTANKEGFLEIATFFKELREVEEAHKERYKALLDRIKNNTMFNSDKVTYYQCLNCGYIHEGKSAPMHCPLCTYERKYFKPYSKECNR